MVRLEELNRTKKEIAKAADEQRSVTQRSFRAVCYSGILTNVVEYEEKAAQNCSSLLSRF